jgi:hypothetical protein
MSDLLQAAPERIFETDAGLVAIDLDGAFDDLRFHGSPFELKAVLGSYRDSSVKGDAGLENNVC